MKPRDLPNPSGRIDALIAEITDWRSKTLDPRPQDALVRAAIEYNQTH